MIFRPMFSPADMISTTLGAALMLNGHWLAAIPVAIVGGLVAHFGRKRMLRQPAFRKVPRR